MPDQLDYELRAIEADRHTETALSVSMAQGWRAVASGYRLLADFIARERAALSKTTDEHRVRCQLAGKDRP